MPIVNLTPHAITLRTPSGADVTFPPSGSVAWWRTRPAEPRQVEGLPVPVVDSSLFGAVNGLPPPSPDIVYLVSELVLARSEGRTDIFTPATGPADGVMRFPAGHPREGQVLAVTRLMAALVREGMGGTAR